MNDTIPPFPVDIDRIAFGHWLSGFCDGEASFLLFLPLGRTGKPAPRAEFRIALRADELPVLNLIRSYLGCGRLIYNQNSRSKIPNAKPVITFTVHKCVEIVGCLLPHFERYPLFAKKKADLAIWREAVAVWEVVTNRKQVFHRSPTGNRIVGVDVKWTALDVERFRGLMTRLRDGRAFVAPAIA